jgi:hypothetical protein
VAPLAARSRPAYSSDGYSGGNSGTRRDSLYCGTCPKFSNGPEYPPGGYRAGQGSLFGDDPGQFRTVGPAKLDGYARDGYRVPTGSN